MISSSSSTSSSTTNLIATQVLNETSVPLISSVGRRHSLKPSRTELCCLVTELHVCEQLVHRHYMKWNSRQLNLQPLDHKSVVVTITPLYLYKWNITSKGLFVCVEVALMFTVLVFFRMIEWWRFGMKIKNVSFWCFLQLTCWNYFIKSKGESMSTNLSYVFWMYGWFNVGAI